MVIVYGVNNNTVAVAFLQLFLCISSVFIDIQLLGCSMFLFTG